jgi:purine nucleosidase
VTSTSETVKVHLDTDIGGDIDDLCALAMLLRWPGLEITGITTVAEHDGIRAGYARYVLALAERREIPVAAGADVRLGCFTQPTGLPPEEEYWPEPVAAAPGPLQAALDLLERSIELGAIIVGVGPFTNLSRLECRRPGILRRAQVVLMGANIRPGAPGFPDWTFDTDYNVQADPMAARHVLDSTRATMVPIEITAQTALRRSHLPALEGCGPLGSLMARQARAFEQEWHNDSRYGRTCVAVHEDIINFLHDPLACAVALGWEGVVVEEVPLALERGGGWLRMRIDASGARYPVVTAVDGDAFNAFWVSMISAGRRSARSRLGCKRRGCAGRSTGSRSRGRASSSA